MLTLLLACAIPTTSTPDVVDETVVRVDCAGATADTALNTLVLGSDTPQSLEDGVLEELAHYMAADSRGGLTFVAGTPGLLVIDASSGTPVELSRLTLGSPTMVHANGDGTLLLSDQLFQTWLVDVTNPANPREIDMWMGQGVVAVSDDDRHLLMADGRLVNNLGQPVATGLGSTRDLVVVGDTALVIEREWGLTSVNLQTGTKTSVATVAPPTSAAVAGDWLYVGLGSDGVQVFDISNPANPQRAGVVATVGTVSDVEVVDGTLWAATVDGVATFDLSDPASPALVGHQPTPGYTLALAPSWGGVVLADWTYVHQLQRGPDSPVLELSHRSMAIDGKGSLVLTNPSALPLQLLGAESTDGVRIDGVPDMLAPGERAVVDVEADVEGSFCLVSDDAAAPARRVPVDTGSGLALAVGEQAPELRLTGLDGQVYDLADQRGRNVVLVFFNTWCAVCLPEIDDVLNRSDAWDAEVWLVSPLLTSWDTAGNVQDFADARGIDLPVLIDEGGAAYYQWQVEQTEQALFPQNWVIGPDGTIVYASNAYQPDAIEQALGPIQHGG